MWGNVTLTSFQEVHIAHNDKQKNDTQTRKDKKASESEVAEQPIKVVEAPVAEAAPEPAKEEAQVIMIYQIDHKHVRYHPLYDARPFIVSRLLAQYS